MWSTVVVARLVPRRVKPRHALTTPRQDRFQQGRAQVGRVARFAVPGVAVAALGVGVAVSVPQQSVTTAVPAPAGSPLARASEQAISRSDARPALTPSPSASSSKKAEEQSEKKTDEKTDEKAEKADVKAEQAKQKAPQPTRSGSAGTRYAEVALNLRSAPKDSARTGTDVAAGSKVSVTGWTLGEWAQVKSGGSTRWLLRDKLSTTKPKAASAASSSSGGVSGGACASGSAVERGLTPDAVKVHRAICHAFPSVTSYGGVRADSLPEHPSGRALDAMVSGARGWEVANWVRAHAKELGVSQVIHAQKIWTVQRGSEGWRSMSDRGSASANHYDHVHVTVYGNAA